MNRIVAGLVCRSNWFAAAFVVKQIPSGNANGRAKHRPHDFRPKYRCIVVAAAKRQVTLFPDIVVVGLSRIATMFG